MKHRTITIAGSGLAMIAALAGGAPATRRASAATTGKTAAQEFKNIQVLKDIPADELLPTMQFISASLGVECEFCHVERQMDKDDKKTKKTAREMIRMVLAINQNNFSGQREVTCNTCHRGAIRPEGIPAVRVEARKPATTEGDQDDETARANWPSGDAVLAKYLDALGGPLSTRLRREWRRETPSWVAGADCRSRFTRRRPTCESRLCTLLTAKA